ncbi:MAG: TlpA disulfide reductase family protein [Candidatus Omnitrophota bacterium]|nr:TlpA disulfide reductase family protein [Candidatus Omnitrophota bacterium]
MKRVVFGKCVVLISMVFLLGACAQTNAVEIGENAPNFTLPDLKGKQVSLSDFKGKVIILNFFASWCPPCRQEVPDFTELQKTYGDKGFSAIGVALESLKDASAFADKAGINYPVLIDDNKASNTYGPIRAIPATFIIGKDFKVAKIYIGARSKEVFEKDIKELL